MNKFKDYKFSEGEDLTEKDLEVIAYRSNPKNAPKFEGAVPILSSQINLEKQITKLVEELYDIEVSHTIKADFQHQLKKDVKDLSLLLEQVQDPYLPPDAIKLMEGQIKEKAININLLEKGQGSFNILMLPILLQTKTKRNVADRETKVTNLKLLFVEALETQNYRTALVEAKFPGINKKNGNDFNLFLMEGSGSLLNEVKRLS